jgi:MHS family proline/betaine transporter-like MFS transporter
MMAGLLLAVLLYRPIYKKMYSLSDISTKVEVESAKSIQRIRNANDTTVTIKTSRVFTDQTIQTETKVDQSTVAPKTEVFLAGNNYWWMIALVFIQVLFVTMVYGPIAAFLVELFPTKIRYTSMSLPYHIGNGIFGGLVPFIATSLYIASKTEANPAGDPFAGLWYPIIVAAITFVIGMNFLSNKAKAEVME